LCLNYGAAFQCAFSHKAKEEFRRVNPCLPDIGGSVFRFNFAFTPAYIAWYRTALSLDVSHEETIKLIWQINELLIRLVPEWLRAKYGAKFYLGAFREKAPLQALKTKQNKLPEYDYAIDFRNIDEDCFEINIYSCGMKKLCDEQGASGLFPGVCRIDYLVAHLLGCGFSRSKTLGGGDDCCDCRYSLSGSCGWDPEKGCDGNG
jgi:hypothetical protein